MIRPASHITAPHEMGSDGHRPVVMDATMNAHSTTAARVTAIEARCRARAWASSTASSGTANPPSGRPPAAKVTTSAGGSAVTHAAGQP